MSSSHLAELDQTLKELISTPSGRRTFIAALPLLMAGCATGPQTRYREGDNSGQEVNLTVADERRMTQQYLQQMRKDYPPVADRNLQRYVSGLGVKLANANGIQGNPYNYNFTVVDVPYVNAFALPAGTVFVTAPLIEMADSEAELIGVIGHEVGHIQARHTAERMFKQEKSKNKGLLYGAAGAVLGGLLGFGAGKLACKPKDKKCLQKAALIGAGAGAAGGFLIQKYGFMANSREDEMEADRIGFRTAVKTGYHKDYVGKFYSKLLAMEEKSKGGRVPILASFADAMSTHPPSRERVAQMNQMAAEASGSGRISTKSFVRMKGVASQYARAARARAKASQKRG